MKVLAWSISPKKSRNSFKYCIPHHITSTFRMHFKSRHEGRRSRAVCRQTTTSLKVKVFTSCHTPLSSIVNRRSTLLETFHLCFQSKRTLWWCLKDTACGVIPVCNENNRFSNSRQTNLFPVCRTRVGTGSLKTVQTSAKHDNV